MIRAWICSWIGHDLVPARRVGVMPAEFGGRPVYATCDAADSRGMLCKRCGYFDEHPWVETARHVTGREP